MTIAGLGAAGVTIAGLGAAGVTIAGLGAAGGVTIAGLERQAA